jgi:hypothetical protein
VIADVDQGVTANGNQVSAEAVKALAELDQRVTRLEDALATMHDTSHIEDRLVERVARRIGREPDAQCESSGLLIQTSRQLLPAAAKLMQEPARATGEPAADDRRGHRWLLYDLYAEGRTIVRMYLDRRYRMTWPARFVPLALLILIFTSWIWLPFTSILPSSLMTVVDKIIDLLLAFCGFRILSRETRRYRSLLGETPPP